MKVDTAGLTMRLPDARGLQEGGPYFYLSNTGTEVLRVVDWADNVLGTLGPNANRPVMVFLRNINAADGSADWSFSGEGWVKKGTGSLPAWTPSRLGSAVKGWYKADAISSLSDGDEVSSWVDSSGNGNTLTNSQSGASPSYQTNELNGLPIVRFDKDPDNGDNMLNADLGGDFEPGQGDFFLAMVAKFPTSGVTQFVMTKAASGTQGLNVFIPTNNSFVFRPGTHGSVTNNLGQATVTDNQFHIFVCRRRSEGETTHVLTGKFDGSDFTTTTPQKRNDSDMNNDADFRIGSSSTGGLDADMDLAEALIGVGTLSDDDMQRLTGYLAHKWGLA